MPANQKVESPKNETVDQSILPILRLLSDQKRLSILETIIRNEDQPVESKLILEVTGISSSSFFKFIEELIKEELVESSHRGAYSPTILGSAALKELTGISNRMGELFVEVQLTKMRKGLESLRWSQEEVNTEINRARRIAEAKRSGTDYNLGF